MSNYHILDTTRNTQPVLPCLQPAGIQTIIRYYSARYNWKVIKQAEAQAISERGLDILVVYQDNQTHIDDFSRSSGYEKGLAAARYGQDSIQQPLGSAIYFAVDFDPSLHEIEAQIIPFFQGIRDAFQAMGQSGPIYKIGAYGSGLTVNTLKNAGLVDFRWLSQSYGFRGTRQAIAEKEYELRQICSEEGGQCSTQLCGIDIDFNEKRSPDTSIGSFQVPD